MQYEFKYLKLNSFHKSGQFAYFSQTDDYPTPSSVISKISVEKALMAPTEREP